MALTTPCLMSMLLAPFFKGVHRRVLGNIGVAYKGNPISQVLDFVEARKPCLSQSGYIQFATAFLEGARPSANTDLPSIHGAPPCEPNVWGDG